MIRSGIMVKWVEDRTKEYISLDFNGLDNLDGIDSTREVWPDGTTVGYRTQSRVKHLSKGKVQLTLIYKEREQDPALLRRGITWGTLIVELSRTAKSGTATWYWGRNNRAPIRWERVESGLVGKRKQQQISCTERDQGFRGFLLSYERSCAITGETTIDSLEVAHVIPVSEGGAEIAENGMVLRADLHRLYDSKRFYIAPTGKVVNISKEVSGAYRSLLRNRRLPDAVLARVKDALIRRRA